MRNMNIKTSRSVNCDAACHAYIGATDGLWGVPLYTPRGVGATVAPLFPFLALSTIPILFLLRVHRRLRWWKESVPAVPALVFVIGLHAYAYDELSSVRASYADTLYYMAFAVEVACCLTFVPMFLIWLFLLPRNLIENRRCRQNAERRCAVCGYLLRGLPEPRCPECGTVFDRSLLSE